MRSRRLHLEIFVSFVIIVVVGVLLGGAAIWFLSAEAGRVPHHLHEAAEVLVEGLPTEPSARQAALVASADRFGVDLALFDPEGTSLASTAPITLPLHRREERWTHVLGGPGVIVALRDGRWLMGGVRRTPSPSIPQHIALLLLLSMVIAAGTWPIARKMTRRLERLQRGVEDLGSGDLRARVSIEGSDEVAELARAFNASADRIQTLVEGQRRMMASASHELRSPLARLRLSIELLDHLDEDERVARKAEAIEDIAELDRLVEDLLLTGRLEAGRPLVRASVDLLGLVASEAARSGGEVEVGGQPVELQGDEALLRILVRNLLENALRYGRGPSRAIVTPVGEEWVHLIVEDHGPGVPLAERERIFEPFYRTIGTPEANGGGAGLGLALVKRVALLHGGGVTCSSAEDGGARFTVELPRGVGATL